MTPKDIVVFIEEKQGRTARMAFAAALAAKWNAHLIATFVAHRMELNPCNGFAEGAGLVSMLRKHALAVKEASEQTREEFEELARRHDITCEWRFSDGETGEALMLHARHASLAIVGPAERRRGVLRTLSMSEDIIFASGRPTLLLPFDWPADRIGRRIVVGWNGSREAANAVANAMPFLVAAESVHLVVVPEPRVRGILGAEPGVDISRHLARHGVPVFLEQHEGQDAGAVLLERARNLEADMLVIGAYGRPKISEIVFGGATRAVLTDADIPILLSR